MGLPPLVVWNLRARFVKVPHRMAMYYQWRSPEGEDFLSYVDQVVEGGATLKEIGDLLGIDNFRSKYNGLRRGLRDMIR